MVDRTTKVILSVIAGALLVIAGQNAMSPATAQVEACTLTSPCAVFNVIPDEDGWEACSDVPRPCFALSTN